MSERFPRFTLASRRTMAAAATITFSFGALSCVAESTPQGQPSLLETCVYEDDGEHITIFTEEVRHCLGALAIRGRAPKTDYDREKKFGSWRQKDGCDTRETVLIRDLTDEVIDPDTCKILSGTFDDKYTEKMKMNM